MLTELHIRNFALIDDLTVELGPGLNVLTGETGAGKSIVVGALSLLLGERASSEVVRAGTDKAIIEGTFEVDPTPDLLAWLEDRGIDLSERMLILKREVAVEGRSRAWINGSPATAGLLGELGAALVSLHGQHQHQTLLKGEEQRAILDAFADNADLLERVRTAHRQVTDLSARVRMLEDRRREALQRADYLRFQVREIEGAAVQSGEDERLEEEARRLSHAEELLALAGNLARAIGSGGDSASDRLGAARRGLDQLVRIDPSQGELSELFDTAYYALEELTNRLEKYLLLVEHDPRRLDEIRRRQDLLYKLQSKYGPGLDDVLATLARAQTELGLIDAADDEIKELGAERESVAALLSHASTELSSRRASAGGSLAAEVNRSLPEIGMDGGRFEVAIIPLAAPGAHGAEEIEFRVTLNRGFDPKPLAQVASGGELSRVMLALKTILARVDAVPTLIFDEVDAGIGGRVALQIADKLRSVGQTHQVLAITHLPQIASRASRHLLVSKDDSAGRAATTVSELAGEARTAEIARMLGGDSSSDVSLRHARELLEKGQRPAVVG
jgi:DNA repair protein RecN (Recombination protein N)